jgi:hypothetical protein
MGLEHSHIEKIQARVLPIALTEVLRHSCLRFILISHFIEHQQKIATFVCGREDTLILRASIFGLGKVLCGHWQQNMTII